MSHRAATIAIAFVVCTTSAAAIFAQSPANPSALTRSRYLPQYTASGELVLPKNSVWREWVFVGEPLTPNALNGMAHEQSLPDGVISPALSTARM